MATVQQLVGRWRLVDSKGFDEYMKELGVGMALRKMGAMAKPDCIITSDGKALTVKTESTLKTTQFSCNLGEKFEETTCGPLIFMCDVGEQEEVTKLANWFKQLSDKLL
ncbi:PREDICTED: fatty acid-binding protein, epidermal [Elephantulus edwardii]|uniref:fatty acid-binding protein, epidermal n=1 Tax=Elephantulus edwardii TaxID=28737 RepID=UPI0003F08D0F|nr:PREDICTED: fatty acid-binding protein, epidermal [Elephantulus edwardii]